MSHFGDWLRRRGNGRYGAVSKWAVVPEGLGVWVTTRIREWDPLTPISVEEVFRTEVKGAIFEIVEKIFKRLIASCPTYVVEPCPSEPREFLILGGGVPKQCTPIRGVNDVSAIGLGRGNKDNVVCTVSVIGQAKS